MGRNNNTPGAVMSVYTGPQASGNPYKFSVDDLQSGYYRVTAKVTNAFNEVVTDTETIFVNARPSVSVTSTPQTVSDEIGISDISVTFSDPDGDNLAVLVTWQPMGMDNKTPGEISTLFSGSKTSGQSLSLQRTGLTPSYYKVTAKVKDPGGLSATTTHDVTVDITNVPPEVTLWADKPSYVEGDTAIIKARA